MTLLLDQLVPLRVIVPSAVSALIVPWLVKEELPKLIWPVLPCTRMLAPMVKLATPVLNRALLLLPPKSTVPVPPKVSVPWKNRRPNMVPEALPRLTVLPFSVRPLVTVAPELFVRSRSLLNVTPFNVPLLVKVSSAPPASVTVLLRSVPPTRFHEPVLAVKPSVVLVLSSVPVRLTVPPERVNMPNAAKVKLPPRLTVALVAVMVPVLLQALLPLPRPSVPPLAVMVPLLLQVP